MKPILCFVLVIFSVTTFAKNLQSPQCAEVYERAINHENRLAASSLTFSSAIGLASAIITFLYLNDVSSYEVTNVVLSGACGLTAGLMALVTTSPKINLDLNKITLKLINEAYDNSSNRDWITKVALDLSLKVDEVTDLIIKMDQNTQLCPDNKALSIYQVYDLISLGCKK